MRKTTAGRALLALVNIAFLAIAATAIYSAVPPQYSVKLVTLPTSSTSTTLTIPMEFNVTNTGFYDINNFYVILSPTDPSGHPLNSTQTIPVTIARGYTRVIPLALNLSLTYIHANPGNYIFEFRIHSEFAFGLIKFTIGTIVNQTLT
jgi:hypothetical protein